MLFNAMNLDDAERYLGGAYEFMGIAVRTPMNETNVWRRCGRSLGPLARGLVGLQRAPVGDLIAALPSELIAGDDRGRLEAILERYRRSLYPDTVAIDVSACERVQQAQLTADLLAEPVDLNVLLDTSVVEG